MHMQRYIGTKLIKAAPMSRGDYNKYRGWAVPEDEDPSDSGYLVEYIDGGRKNHPDHDGYLSWSPKEVFENAYRQTDGLPFSRALEALQHGMVVRRAGWNGKGMFLYLVPSGKIHSDNPLMEEIFGPEAPRGAYIAMKTAQENVVPWLASQTDLLSSDWELAD